MRFFSSLFATPGGFLASLTLCSTGAGCGTRGPQVAGCDWAGSPQTISIPWNVCFSGRPRVSWMAPFCPSLLVLMESLAYISSNLKVSWSLLWMDAKERACIHPGWLSCRSLFLSCSSCSIRFLVAWAFEIFVHGLLAGIREGELAKGKG